LKPVTTIALMLLGGVSAFAQQAIFAPRVDIGNVPGAVCSVIFDANNDGRQDFAVCASNFVYVFLQNPGPVGTFTLASTINAGTGNLVVSLGAGEFTGDGKQDLAVATNTLFTTSGTGSLSLYPGNGNGTFQTPQTLTSQVGFGAMVVTDLNNDHKPDIVLVTQGNAFIFLGNGTGGFSGPTLLNVNTLLSAVAVGDFNHDGVPDVARNSIFLGNGNGTLGIASTPVPFFTPNNSLAGAPAPSVFLAVADVNNDGFPDIIGRATTESTTVFLGNGDGTFQAGVSQSLGTNTANGFGLADFNFDGRPDVVDLEPGSPSVVNIFTGTGGGQFQTTPLSFPACTTNTVFFSAANALTVGDLNGDGIPDVIASCATSNTVSIFLSLAPSVFLQTSADPSTPGQSVTLTSIVGTPAMGFLYTSGFNVQFYDGATALGSPIPVTSGQATRTTTSLAQGIHFLTASLLNSQGTAVSTSGIVTHVVSSTTCAPNLVGQLNIVPGGFRRNAVTGQYIQTVTVTNTSGTGVVGPVSLALNNLSAGVTALNADGLTACSVPTGVPFVDSGLCPGGTLAPGQSLSVSLAFSNPANKAINYSMAALGGYSPR
jgi:hypothetical protein